MYRDMEQWTRKCIRVNKGESKRQILRETSMHWRTLEKILSHSAPPEFGRRVWPKPKIGSFLERITSILRSDTSLPKKQRHTAKRIFERIREEGYQGGYTAVKDTVRALKRQLGEVYAPLVHRPIRFVNSVRHVDVPSVLKSPFRSKLWITFGNDIITVKHRTGLVT